MNTDIMFSGVGGQGLVLMTSIVSLAAFNNGYDVKTNDVIGLSQRGGTVSGSVRMGKNIYSPNIRPGTGDILVALEPLEALRWSHILKKDGLIILNNKEVLPTSVQQEKEEYPKLIIDEMMEKFSVISLDAVEEAKKLGKPQMANIILIGILSKHLDIPEVAWENAIKKVLKPTLVEMNLHAFRVTRQK